MTRTGERISKTEVNQFQPRVGRTPEARLQWAIDFSQKDLDGLTVGDWANLQREFIAFSAITITPDALDAPWIRSAIAGGPWLKAWAEKSAPGGARGPGRGARQGGVLSASVVEKRNWELPAEDQLRSVQSAWREIIERMLKPNGTAWVGPVAVDVYVQRVDKERRSRLEFEPEKPDPMARLPLVALLGAFAHRLRRCPEVKCRRQFIASRKGQAYCSRTCQNRAAIRAHRAKIAGQGLGRHRAD